MARPVHQKIFEDEPAALVEWTTAPAARSFMLDRDRIVVDTNYFVRRSATWTVEMYRRGLGHLRTYNVPDAGDDRAKNATRTTPRTA